MYTHADRSTASSRPVRLQTPAAATFQPVNNRSEATVQRRLQALANDRQTSLRPPVQRVENVVVQREPLSDELTAQEETDIDNALKANDYALAATLLKQSALFTRLDPGNIGSVTYSASGKGYGSAQQDRVDPANNNSVTIVLEKAAMKSVPILVSTFIHELLHAKQYTMGSNTGKQIDTAKHVYGYAKEASPYLTAAQEIETHHHEIMNAKKIGTNTDAHFMKDRGIAISDQWTRLYNATRGENARSKASLHKAKAKPLVEKAYEQLNAFNVDTSTFDRRGLAKPADPKKRKTP